MIGTISQYGSRVLSLVATIAATWWTNWCLRCCCVSLGGGLVEGPIIGASFGSNRTWLKCFWSHDLLLFNGEEDDHEKNCEVPNIK